MSTISLAVTQRVLNAVNSGQEGQRQLAMRRPSSEIESLIRGATAREPVTLRLGGRVSVTVGDSGAIWRVHQHDRADFDSLFEILARQPDTDMEFVCEAE